ncbi:MAG: CinA family protein [Xanthomonadales bacterium]|nr:CinA family protein [Xanthomonadales bacterium]
MTALTGAPAGAATWPADDDSLQHLARTLANALLARKLHLATAESCTGGWIGQVLTALPGSSAWFEGGVVSYSNAAKQSLLGVRERTLVEEGAVSGTCAQEMAAGAGQRFGTGVAVAVTGIAGPDGGSLDKPVGTVWIGWQLPGQSAQATRFLFAGDRQAVRRQTVAAALSGLVERLEALELPAP